MKAPRENRVAALIPRSLINPRKKLFVPKKTPAMKLGKIRNFSGFSPSDEANYSPSAHTAVLKFTTSKISPPLSPIELAR